jgi:pyruvate dehydrogenase E2 component (dihydrolipoamide acetyltransferase)
VSGSGPDGRILLRDIETTAPSAETLAAGKPHPAPNEAPDAVRLAMAEHMSNSVHTLAHSTINFEARADAFLALFEKLGAKAKTRDVRLTPTALFAKCAGAALRDHTRFNATIDEDACKLILHEDVNLSIALASERGLLVPVVGRINQLSLFAVARQLSDITSRGRDGTLDPADVRGGTFTLSNTGNMERATITSTRPIINAPQSAILWVSRIVERPRVTDGKVEAGPMVACSLSFDHRFIDGADAVAFVNDVAAHIENPEQALATD